MTVFKKLSVYARIGLLGGLVALVLAALSATLWFADTATSDALERQQNFSEIERLALETEIGALQMRRREKDFLLRRDASYFERYLEDEAHVEETLNAIEALDAPADIDTAIDRLNALLPQHRAVFGQVVDGETALGLTHTDGLEGQLRSAVHAVEEELSAREDSELAVLMLMMRRHEKDFMLRGEPRYIEAFDARQGEFADLLATRDLPAETAARIRDLMAAYSRDFHAWAERRLAVNETVGELSDVFAEMAPEFDAVASLARQEARAATAQLAADRSLIRQITIGLVFAIAAIAALLCWLVGRSIAGPVNALTETMDRLVEGDTATDVPATDQGGEIGRMARSVLVFQKNQIEIERLREEQAAAEARAADEKRRIMAEMADEFDANVGSIANEVAAAAAAMIETAARLRETAQESEQRSTTAAGAAEETSANTQAVASAAEELTSSIHEITRQVGESRTLTGQAVTEADSTLETVSGLGAAVARIGDVVTLIRSIAEQTNLLALNATIEASRAGEAGKGFAVVASEVKELADQTAKATVEIADQIEAIQSRGDDASAAIQSMTGTIDRVSQSTSAIAVAIEQQNGAATEIAGNVAQAAAGTAQVTESIAVLARNVRDTDDGADQVLRAARAVSDDTDRLRTALSGFLNDIRAA